MSTDENDCNPYVSPLAADTADRVLHKRFPWRIIVVGVLCLYGGLAFLNGAIALFMILGGCSVRISHGHVASNAQTSLIALAMFVMGVHGGLAIVAAWHFWKQRWRQGIASIIAAVAAAIPICVATYVAGQLPPGPEFPPRSNRETQELRSAISECVDSSLLSLSGRRVVPQFACFFAANRLLFHDEAFVFVANPCCSTGLTPPSAD